MAQEHLCVRSRLQPFPWGLLGTQILYFTKLQLWLLALKLAFPSFYTYALHLSFTELPQKSLLDPCWLEGKLLQDNRELFFNQLCAYLCPKSKA